MLLNLTVNTIQLEKMTAVMTPLFYPSATELHRPHNSPGLRLGCDDFIMFAPMVLHSYLLPFDPRHAVWKVGMCHLVRRRPTYFGLKQAIKYQHCQDRSGIREWVEGWSTYLSFYSLPVSFLSLLFFLIFLFHFQFPSLQLLVSIPALLCLHQFILQKKKKNWHIRNTVPISSCMFTFHLCWKGILHGCLQSCSQVYPEKPQMRVQEIYEMTRGTFR